MTYIYLTIAALTVFVSPIVALVNIVLAAGSVWLDCYEAREKAKFDADMKAIYERAMSR